MEKTEFNARNISKLCENNFKNFLEKEREKEELLRKQSLSDFKILLTEEMKKKIEEGALRQSNDDRNIVFIVDYFGKKVMIEKRFSVDFYTKKELSNTEFTELEFQIKNWLSELGFIDISSSVSKYEKNKFNVCFTYENAEADDLL